MKWWGLMLVAACGLPEPTLVGAHVQLAMDPGLVPCGDAVGHLDAYVESLAAAWRTPPPSGVELITYYWLDDADFESRTVCGENNCSLSGDVYATKLPHDHEVVHAVAHRFGLPPPFFIEGLAVAYQFPADETIVEEATAARVLAAIDEFEAFYLAAGDYSLAGAFVAFVIERHGIEKFMAVYARLDFLDGRGRISRVFSDVFGESLEAAAAAFEREQVPGCPAGGYRLERFECQAPALDWDGVELGEHVTLACDQDGVIGPFGEGTVMLLRTLEVPADGVYSIRVVGDVGAGDDGRANSVELVSCGGCEGYVNVRVTAGPNAEVHALLAGRYVVRLIGPVHVASGVGLHIERVADVEGP